MASKQNGPIIKLKPIMIKLCKSAYAKDVNARLDRGESANKVCAWVNDQGFSISVPIMYEYAKIRKQCILNNITIESLLKIADRNPNVEQGPGYEERKSKIKSELDVLDKIINKGYDSLDVLYNEDNPLPPNLTMAAIQLKNSLTDGSHGFLTDYGMSRVIEVEKEKYDLLFSIALKYIPDQDKEAMLAEAQMQEEAYYRNTEFYRQYLESKNLPEPEIRRRLKFASEEYDTTLRI